MNRKRLALVILFLLFVAGFALVPQPRAALADTFPPGLASGVSVGTGSALKSGTTEVGFGGQRWYVVGFNGSGVNKGAGTITLLSRDVFGSTHFTSDGNPNYKDSLLQAAVIALQSSYDARERSAMASLTLDGVYGTQPTGQTIWAPSLSDTQAISADVRKPGTDDAWWMRTPNGQYYAGYVYDGTINMFYSPLSSVSYTVRPATAISLSKVLFATPIDGVKDGALGDMSAVGAARELKFTLLDSNTSDLNLSIASPPASVTQSQGSALSLDFSGAKTGSGKYVSCILVSQTDGMVKYYAKLSAGAAGTLAVPFPSGILAGSYSLCIFNEQIVSGDNSDYASTPVTIAVTVSGGANTPPARKSGVPATATASVSVGNPYTLNLSDYFTDADGNDLSYRVSINSAAAVGADENYSFTPEAAGTTTLKFTAYDGAAESPSYTVTLTASSVAITKITVLGENGATSIIRSGQMQLSADIKPYNATNQTLTWTCTVSGGGAFPTANIDAANILRLSGFDENGTVTIQAAAQDGSGVSGQLVLSVKQYLATDVTVTSASDFVTVGTPMTMSSSVQPSHASSSVTWSISHGSGIASVTSDGVLSVTGAGSVTVRATAADGSAVYGEKALTAKLTQAAPFAPTLSSKTPTSVTLNSIANAEYTKDLTNWQDSATFSGLTPNTSYSFCARLAETGTYSASPASASLSVTTDKPALGGAVSITGAFRYAQILSADTDALASTPESALGTFSYRWQRDGGDIPGATDAGYTLTTADVGKVINVTVTASDCIGSVSSTNAVPTAKENPAYSVPSGLTATYGQTLADVSLPARFSWEDANTTHVGNAGSNSFNVTFTPADTADYNTVTGIAVTVAVARANPVYSVPTGLTATYGQTLADVDLPAGFSWEDADTTSVGDAGGNSFSVTCTPSDTDNYNTVTGISVTVTVGKATPAYTVPTGLAATYGQTLADVPLPARFGWEDADATSVGSAGSNGFHVTYTPADTANYQTVTGIAVTVAVSRANPVYSVPTGLTATYGQTLADVDLPAGFGWEDADTTSVGDAGGNSFSVTFTPSDTDNYNTVTGISVTVTVGKAIPAYTVPTGLTVTYGQTLADVSLPAGFAWEDADTTSVGSAGSNGFRVTFTPADTANYQTVTGISVTIAVSRANPVCSAPTGLTATYGQTLSDVALPTGFAWEAALSTRVGDVGDNSFDVTYTPSDTDNYNTVTGIAVTISVGKKTPTYTIPSGLTATFGQTLSDVDLPVGFAWEDAHTTSVGSAGSNSFNVTYTPDDTDNYNTVTGIAVTISVGRKTPTYTIPSGLTATYGQTLADVALPAGFAWESALAASVGDAGASGFTVRFTPADTANYRTVTGIPVTVTVGKATPVYTVPTGLAATYGQTLANVSLPAGFSWEAALSTRVGNVGSRSFKVKYTPSDTSNYKTVAGITVTVSVGLAAPAYSIPTGLTATYGQTLANVALPSGFSWEAAPGTHVGSAGSRSFTVRFTPADTANYRTVTGISVTVAVGKATPVYTAPAGLTATYGQTLADVTLPAGFSWEAAPGTQVGNAGSRHFTVRYTPADTSNYYTVSAISVTIAVGKAAPAHTVPTGLTATYGQTLADVTLPAGFSWEAALGTHVGNAGVMSFTVKFKPADTANYQTVTGISVSVTVGKAAPAYTIPTGLTATYGQTLANVSLPAGFSWEAAQATRVGNAGVRSFTVKFIPADTSNYNSVTGITVTITVGKATPVYAVPTGLTATYGQTLANVTLPSGFGWEAAPGTHVGNAGSRSFTVKFIPADTANYKTVSGISVAIAVGKAIPDYITPAGLSATYGQTLANVSLPAGFSWEAAPSTLVGDAGSSGFTVRFTPKDTANYKTVAGIHVTIAVGKATPGYTVPTGLTAMVGQTLADVPLPDGFAWEAALSTRVGNAGNRSFRVKFTPDDTANYKTVTGISVTIRVEGNDPPARKAGIPAETTAGVTVNTAFTLDLSTIFEDKEDDTLTYTVSVGNGAAESAAEQFAYTPASPGTVTLVFKANDGLRDSRDSYKVTLTVTAAPPQTWALTVRADEGGSVAAGADGNYKSGDVVTLSAAPASGYAFHEWTSSGGGVFANAGDPGTTFTMPSAAVTVTATFTKNAVTYVPAPGIVNQDTQVTADLTQGSTTMSANQIDTLADLNRDKPVVMTGEGYSVTFPQGSLKPAVGSADFDFGISFDAGDDFEAVKSLAGDGFIKMVNFNSSGALPGEAEVRINVGRQYAGGKMYYYSYNQQAGKLELVQDATVDENGYITVRQSKGAEYVLSIAGSSKPVDAPKTQNVGGGLVWWLLGAAAVAGIAVIVLLGRMKSQKKKPTGEI